MTLLLDSGALIAYERRSRTVQAFLERAERTGDAVATTAPVVAQTWRADPRQARLAMLLAGMHEEPLTPPHARRIGGLLRLAGTTDVVDASLVELAKDGDEILTGDLDDMRTLAMAARKTLIITKIS